MNGPNEATGATRNGSRARIVGRVVVAVLLAGATYGAWTVYWVISVSIDAEWNLQATWLTIELVEQFVTERGRWPHSWNELEVMPVADRLREYSMYRWPEGSAEIRQRIVIEFDADVRHIVTQDVAEFHAIRPIGTCFVYKEAGCVRSLQNAIRASIPMEP